MVRAGLAAAVLAIAATACAPAAACTIRPPAHPPTRLQIEQQVLRAYRRAAALVEVEVLVASNLEQPGRARVLRVYKGNVPIGREYALRGMDSSMCGAGDMVQGTRGVIMLYGRDEPVYFPGFLDPDTIAILRRRGLRGI